MTDKIVINTSKIDELETLLDSDTIDENIISNFRDLVNKIREGSSEVPEFEDAYEEDSYEEFRMYDDFDSETFIREVGEWAEANFDRSRNLDPFMGIIEEMGEFYEADTFDEVADAYADVCIYMADALGRNEIEGFDFTSDGACMAFEDVLMHTAPQMAHYSLKMSQGIRGDRSSHEESILRCFREILGSMESLINDVFFDSVENMTAEGIVLDVWERVKKRNWKANPTDGTVSES